MTAPARLLGLRLQGFKSFADRTHVEFGGGISAIVGPNGSGKSNLADGLRWALGEQGRSLRTRKSEDVIFAGSDRRAALGMADVTLVLDNSDGLLPVDYSVLELGRRLYRSGENDYLLNKQRVRLRDLVDLLDGAHLADNAFLFIGQGMVDQALALRPEERRPLFEEVAGVRRHERRRRKAEEQLTESEANLARVEDVLVEIRPQARRLAAQAEQQATRASAGDELAAALLLSAHARWHEAAGRAREARARREVAREAADRAMADLAAAEESAAGIAASLGERAAVERERRERYEGVRSELAALRLREARLAGDLESLARERRRLEEERATAETELGDQRRGLVELVPSRDDELELSLSEAERALGEALSELGGLRTAHQAQGEALDTARRAEAARQAEIETAGRRGAEAERRAADERAQAQATGSRRAELEEAAVRAREARDAAVRGETTAAAAREEARSALDRAEGERREAEERSAAASSRLAAFRGQLAAIESRLGEDETRGIARAARRVGGRRLDEELVVDPALRGAVEAALAEAARAYLVERSKVAVLAGERGMLVVGGSDGLAGARSDNAAERTFRDRLAAMGGGPLADAVRRDPTSTVAVLLARAVWLPDLETAVAIQPDLPPGWVAVTRDGGAVLSSLTIALGRAEGLLDRRVERSRLAAELEGVATEAAALARRASEATAATVAARSLLDRAQVAEAERGAARRRAEEAERIAARDLESIVREADWHAAQATRLEADASRAREVLSGLEAPSAALGSTEAGETGDAGALAAWEARALELRARRDRLAAAAAERDGMRRAVEARRARAEAVVAMDEAQIARADRDLSELAEREAALRAEAAGLVEEAAAATAREETARLAVDELRTADADDRRRLSSAESAATAARDRLRTADGQVRATDVADLEARLGLDAIREGVLVELAGLGELGARMLGIEDLSDEDPEGSAHLEAALATIAVGWAATPAPAEPPSPGRLAGLRRRYHELGAANPFAVEEYEALKVRLESLETQGHDLREAISTTRGLIDELNTMIADQFRSTFEALEVAFDERFQQLFGGGFARLSLTDPSDLPATGVEIVARPPGKKAQALAMLSGGERALTAVALLFAMLEVRPVPFCVLDEVDAALDEANIGRFSDALRSLAGETQFIVITHNRGTIEAADALYGVTVGDDSVSRVISLRLDEARDIAERVRDSTLVEVSPN